MDYEYAQYYIQKLGIKSARQYKRWVREWEPAGFPVFPEKAYSDSWVSWNEFLGGDNRFSADYPQAVREKDLLPYWDAVSYVHPFRFANAEEYREAFDAGKLPHGIPRQPHLRYSTFYHYGGWKGWLGKDAATRVQAEQSLEPVLVIYRASEQSPNVLSIIIHTKGDHALRSLIEERQLKVVRLFHWYPEFADHVFEMLNHFGTQQTDTSWLFANVNEILFELSSVLEIYKVE